MLLDQNTKKNHYTLQIKDGERVIPLSDFKQKIHNMRSAGVIDYEEE